MRRLLSVIAWGLPVILLSVFAFGNSVFAQTDNYCRLLDGQSRTYPVSEGDSLNEGIFQFNLNPTLVKQYRSCAKMFFLETIGKEADLDGWVWNSNLGWTALGAYGSAAPYSNSGISFSNYYFRSFVKYTSPTSGQLRGWWWNDTTGWISLHCLDTVGQCANSNYGGQVDALGNVTGFAWSDSVGWIDLTGIKLPTSTELAIVPTVNVSLIPVRNGSQFNGPVYANVSALGYKLAVGFDFEGQTLLNDFDFDFTTLFKDKTLAQQIAYVSDPATGNYSLTFPDLPADRANQSSGLLPGKTLLTKRFSGGQIVNGFTIGGADQFTKTTVSGKNVYLSTGILQSKVPTVYGKNNEAMLELVSMPSYAAKRLSSGEAYAVGQFTPINRKIDFLPPVSTQITQGGLKQLSLNLGPNISTDISINQLATFDSVSNLRFGLAFWEPGNRTYNICLSETGDDFTECEIPEDQDPPLGFANKLFTVPSRDFSQVPNKLTPFIQYLGNNLANFRVSEGAGLYAYVTYTSDDKSYAFLTGSLLSSAFQVFDAEVKGTTRAQGGAVLTDEATTLPASSQRLSRLRESYLRYAQALIKGQRVSQANVTLCDTDDSSKSVNLSACQLLGSTSQTRRVYFVQSKDDKSGQPLSLDLGSIPSGLKEVVVVIMGRDVVIDENQYFKRSDDGVDQSKNLVLMAFKNGAGIGGNVYVRSDVTLLQANVFADGSLFSVGTKNTWTYDPLDLVPDRNSAMRADMRNQFVLLGSLVSRNTFGGCDLTPPRLGDGSLVRSTTLAAKEEACLYDLNYMRYSPMVANEAGNRLEWPEGDQFALASVLLKETNESLSAAETKMRSAVARPSTGSQKFAIVNFIYQAPPKDNKLPELPSGFTFSN